MEKAELPLCIFKYLSDCSEKKKINRVEKKKKSNKMTTAFLTG